MLILKSPRSLLLPCVFLLTLANGLLRSADAANGANSPTITVEELVARFESTSSKLVSCDLHLILTEPNGSISEDRRFKFQAGAERESRKIFDFPEERGRLNEIMVADDKILRLENFDLSNPVPIYQDPSLGLGTARGSISRSDRETIARLTQWQLLRKFRVAAAADEYSLHELVKVSKPPAELKIVEASGKSVYRLTAYPPPKIEIDGTQSYVGAKIAIDISADYAYSAVRSDMLLDPNDASALRIVFDVAKMKLIGGIPIPQTVHVGLQTDKYQPLYNIEVAATSVNQPLSGASLNLTFPENLLVFEELTPGGDEVIHFMGKGNKPWITFASPKEATEWRERTFGAKIVSLEELAEKRGRGRRSIASTVAIGGVILIAVAMVIRFARNRFR